MAVIKRQIVNIVIIKSSLNAVKSCKLVVTTKYYLKTRWTENVVSLIQKLTKYIFKGERIQKQLSITDQIKRLTLNVATRYNTAVLST